MRVVFMGTPDIAATCLKKILADGFEVVGVYTQPDRPKGRGMKLVASPVKEVALAAGIPVLQPENFREEETVEALRELKPDICAVVAYGRILPQKVLDVPTFGCINIHASVLPKYRGSAPLSVGGAGRLAGNRRDGYVSVPGDGCGGYHRCFQNSYWGE